MFLWCQTMQLQTVSDVVLISHLSMPTKSYLPSHCNWFNRTSNVRRYIHKLSYRRLLKVSSVLASGKKRIYIYLPANNIWYKTVIMWLHEMKLNWVVWNFLLRSIPSRSMPWFLVSQFLDHVQCGHYFLPCEQIPMTGGVSVSRNDTKYEYTIMFSQIHLS